MGDGFYVFLAFVIAVFAFFLGLDTGLGTGQSRGCMSACERRGGESVKARAANACACTSGHVLNLDLGAMWVERGRK